MAETLHSTATFIGNTVAALCAEHEIWLTRRYRNGHVSPWELVYVGDPLDGELVIDVRDYVQYTRLVQRSKLREIFAKLAERANGPQLFQRELNKQPFWMLVACMLVNHTRWDVARDPFAEIWMKFGEPHFLAAADVPWLADQLRSLGFQYRRAETLVKLAAAWCVSPPKTCADVRKLPGCGKYAADSWKIFVQRKHVLPNEVEDLKLKAYLEWRLRRARG